MDNKMDNKIDLNKDYNQPVLEEKSFEETIVEVLGLVLVYGTFIAMFLGILYFGMMDYKYGKESVHYTGVVEDDLELFIEGYYNNMNKYGSYDTERFVNDYFTDEYKEIIGVEEVSKQLNLLKSAYGDDLKYTGEVLGVEVDDQGYYIGVNEIIKDGDKLIEEYGGIYILEKIGNEYKIAYITGFFEDEELEIEI